MAGWLQCIEPFPGNDQIFERFEALFTGTGAPKDCALFARNSDDMREHIYLLTPAATKWVNALPGEWTDAGDPREYGWSGLIMHADAFERFGLKTPAQR